MTTQTMILRAVRAAVASSNDVRLTVSDAAATALLTGMSTSIEGQLASGTLAWPGVRYPELEIGGSAFKVINVVAVGGTVTVEVGDQSSENSAIVQ